MLEIGTETAKRTFFLSFMQTFAQNINQKENYTMIRRKWLFIVMLCFTIILPQITPYTYAETVNLQEEIEKTDFENVLNDQYMLEELVEKRSMYSKHYKLSDGTNQMELSQVPIHYEDKQGNFHEIDTSLILESDLSSVSLIPSKEAAETYDDSINEQLKAEISIRSMSPELSTESNFLAPQVPFDLQIPKDISMGYSIGRGDEKFSFIPRNGNHSVGVVDSVYNNKILFNDVWDYTDIELIVTNYGIKENIILKNADAPNQFEFKFIGTNPTSLGNQDLFLLPSWLIDASGEKRDVVSNFIERENETVIQITWDDEGLVYPIIIDPTSTIITPSAVYVDQEFPDKTYAFADTLKVGKKTTGYQYAYLNFPLNSIGSSDTINSVELKVYASKITINYLGPSYADIKAYKVNSNIVPSTSYNTRPSHSLVNSSDFVRADSIGYYNFDITAMTRDALLSRNLNVALMNPDSKWPYPTFEFLTPWQTDNSKSPRLIINYGTTVQPLITSASVSKNDDNSANIMWETQDLSGKNQVAFEYFPLKDLYFQTSPSIIVQGSQKSHTTPILSKGTWSFAIRVFNGEVWSNWHIARHVYVSDTFDYSYSDTGRLTKIISTDGTIVNFNYDQNGNLMNQNIMGTSSNKMIPDGNPIEWINQSRNSFEDGYNDFSNYIVNGKDIREPERDIRSVHYYTDIDHLYIMIELGRISGYETLNPHGYDNDNYYVYLPSNSNTGTTYSRNGTNLGINVEYEIASWHPDDITVHKNITNSWRWEWTGGHEYDGLSSRYKVINNDSNNMTTSAILEMKIPLIKIPNADVSKMIVIAGSDDVDIDIAKK